MNPRALKLFGLILLIGATFARVESYALPPLQHPARGVIQSIDQTNQTFVLAESKGATNRIFVWESYTRFRHGWHKASSEMLQPGQAIKLSCRREIGQLVAYEIRWSETQTNRNEIPSAQSVRDSSSPSVSSAAANAAPQQRGKIQK